MLFWTLRALAQAAPALAGANMAWTKIIVAARREEFELIAPIASKIDSLPIILVEGGATRQESVWNAARAASDEADLLLVHDAARPLVSSDLISRVCNAARETGGALAALGASDTVKIVKRQGEAVEVEATLDRHNVYLAQTPQVFRRERFLEAFARAEAEGFIGTDCASLLERAGYPVAIVEGEECNLKVTYASDMERAENLLRPMV